MREMLLLKQEGQTRFSRFDDAYFSAHFAPGEYGYLQEGCQELFYDLRPEARREAGQNLVYLGLTLLIVLAFLLRYAPHFALTVTDPLQAMRRVLEERRARTEGAVEKSRADIAAAEARTAEYEQRGSADGQGEPPSGRTA